MWSNIISNASDPDKARRIDEWYEKNGYGGKEMEKKSLEVGEKFLSIQVEVGGVTQRFAAFKNKAKKNPLEPDYKGQNIAIWISAKKADKNGSIKVEEL